MLKLSQINIQTENELIVKVLEPIVYDKVGAIAKTDEIILKDKNNAFYLIAEVVRLTKELSKQSQLKVGTFVMISKHSFSPINFPIEGYDSPQLATIHKDSIFAIIDEDEEKLAD